MVYIKRKCAESIIHFNLNAHLSGKHLAISDHLLTHIGKERITYVFIANSGLNWSVYILEIVQNIDKLICNFRNIYGCLTLNKVHIKLTSLSLFSINDNLINASTTSPLEGGWGVGNSTLYSTFNKFSYLNRSLWKHSYPYAEVSSSINQCFG